MPTWPGTQSPGHPSGNSDVGASLSYRSNWVEGKFERRKIGPNFNPEVGFIELTNTKETYGDTTFKVRPKISGRPRVAIRRFYSPRA